jgi:lipoprotein LprG
MSARCLVAAAVVLAGCGSPPPAAAPLLSAASHRMLGLHTFHFTLAAQGQAQHPPLVQDAEGDVRPPDVTAKANLREGDVLLEVDLIVVGAHAYLKSFTGGWQETNQQQLARYFDVSALFDPDAGLFAVLPQTQAAVTGKQDQVGGHATYQVTGQLPADAVHRLLPLAADTGADPVTYWIEPQTNTLWQARISGPLFDASLSSITFTFSGFDHPVTITPPAVG